MPQTGLNQAENAWKKSCSISISAAYSLTALESWEAVLSENGTGIRAKGNLRIAATKREVSLQIPFV
jgi:hypothetical protein